MKFPSLSIYPKLVLTFMFVLTPLYAYSLIMNDSGSRSVKVEITKSMISKVHFYSSELDSEFARIISLLQEFVNDDDLNKLSLNAEVMSDIEKVQAILRLQEKLNLIKKISKYFENVSAYIPLLDRTVSANQRYISDFNHAEYTALLVPTNFLESPFIYWQNKLFISVPYPESTFQTKRPPIFLLVIEVSMQEIVKVLGKFADDGQGGSFIYSNTAKQWIITADASTKLTHQILEILEQRKNNSSDEGIASVKLDNKQYMVAFQRSSVLGSTFIMYVPEANVLGPLNQYRKGFWLLSAVSAIVVLLFSYQIYLFIHQPLKILIRSFRRVEKGDLNIVVHHRFDDEFRYLYNQFNGMVSKLNVLVHEVYEQKYRARSSELKHLQSQINPHFLYNSFFVLYRMTKSQDYDNLEKFTKYLGDYFQFITRDGLEMIPLEMEVKYARTYTEIQTMRFSNRIHVDFHDLPEACRDMEVPRLILQPIIENCYNHGLENKVLNGIIDIEFFFEADMLIISIQDNSEQMNDEELLRLQHMLSEHADLMESTGMVNVHRRIMINYGKTGGLILSIGKYRGLLVQMCIPLHPQDGEALYVSHTDY
jgi:two-component system sensor histidine kinase YesM